MKFGFVNPSTTVQHIAQIRSLNYRFRIFTMVSTKMPAITGMHPYLSTGNSRCNEREKPLYSKTYNFSFIHVWKCSLLTKKAGQVK